jgi:hypothetical protein
MNITRKTTISAGGKLVNTNRQTAIKEDPKVKPEVRKMTHYRKITGVLIATIALAALAFGLPAAAPVHAAGLRNCVDVTGPAAAHVACYELVWANGVQFTMTFANQGFTGATPSDKLDNFYVVAPQTGAPQGTLPFLHDHVVRDVPRQNHGDYSVKLRGIFALCSAQGITSGACVPYMATYEGFGTLPLAKTVNGQELTSVEPIESAAASGLITLLDTGAVLVGTINPGQ